MRFCFERVLEFCLKQALIRGCIYLLETWVGPLGPEAGFVAEKFFELLVDELIRRLKEWLRNRRKTRRPPHDERQTKG